MQYFKKCVLENYANFEGRARRKEYWHFVLFNGIAGVVAELIDKLIGSGQFADGAGIGWVSLVVSLALVVPGLAVAVRRLHDIGKSGWSYFVILIPLVGAFVFLYWMLIDGDAGDNAYGPNPKALSK